MQLLPTLTALGCALVAGVFAAFSGFVMAALGRITDDAGAAATRSVNVTAVRPPLMVLLFGSAAACVAVLCSAYRRTWTRWNHLRAAAALLLPF